MAEHKVMKPKQQSTVSLSTVPLFTVRIVEQPSMCSTYLHVKYCNLQKRRTADTIPIHGKHVSRN